MDKPSKLTVRNLLLILVMLGVAVVLVEQLWAQELPELGGEPAKAEDAETEPAEAAPGPAGPVREEVVQHFKQGVDFYERGRFAQAAAEFNRVLRMRPDMGEALQMRKAADVARLIEMRRKEELKEPVGRLIDLLTRAEREKIRDKEAIKKLLTGDQYESEKFQQYIVAAHRLSYHGQYAVPFLLKYLELPKEQVAVVETEEQIERRKAFHRDLVSRTLITIDRMKRSATMPLLQALQNYSRPGDEEKEALFKTRIIAALGHVGDRRAVPVLKEFSNDPNPTIAEYAGKALEQITGKKAADLAAAHQLYYDLALAYFHSDHEIVGYIYEDVYDVWKWNADAPTLAQKLDYVPVPAYLAFLKLAERYCMDGLELEPDDMKLQTLLVNIYYRQLTLVERRAKAPQTPEFGGIKLSGKAIEDAQERLSNLQWRAESINRASGPDVLASALQMALDEKDAPTALLLIQAIFRVLQPQKATAADAAAKAPFGPEPAQIPERAPEAEAAPATAEAAGKGTPQMMEETHGGIGIPQEPKPSRPHNGRGPRRQGAAPQPAPVKEAEAEEMAGEDAAAEEMTAGEEAAMPGEPAAEEQEAYAPAAAVRRALEAGDKLVRFRAAVALVKSAPGGEFGATEETMRVLSTMLSVTSAKTALVIMNDLQVRNRLAAELRTVELATVESTADIGQINNTLLLEPAIDIVFLTADLPQDYFVRLLDTLKRDERTSGLPIIIVKTGAEREAQTVQAATTAGIADVLESDVIVSRYLEEAILKKHLKDIARTTAAKEQEQFIIDACNAVADINPLTTRYELAKYLEQPLTRALHGHSDAVKTVTIEALSRFGTERALNPLRALAVRPGTPEVRAAALKTFGEIALRSGHEAQQVEIQEIRQLLKDENAKVRIAAGQALGLLGVEPATYLEITKDLRPELK